ncbi:hypothetical protein CDD83_8763 [Cordyceps sp. RAO-2017]|nr:hypothetical protein CDD83_8763 [Cordyceps sp. RAO-2017]
MLCLFPSTPPPPPPPPPCARPLCPCPALLATSPPRAAGSCRRTDGGPPDDPIRTMAESPIDASRPSLGLIGRAGISSLGASCLGPTHPTLPCPRPCPQPGAVAGGQIRFADGGKRACQAVPRPGTEAGAAPVLLGASTPHGPVYAVDVRRRRAPLFATLGGPPQLRRPACRRPARSDVGLLPCAPTGRADRHRPRGPPPTDDAPAYPGSCAPARSNVQALRLCPYRVGARQRWRARLDSANRQSGTTIRDGGHGPVQAQPMTTGDARRLSSNLDFGPVQAAPRRAQ